MFLLIAALACGEDATIEIESTDGENTIQIATDADGQGTVTVKDAEGKTVAVSGEANGGDASVNVGGAKGVTARANDGAELDIAGGTVTAGAGGTEGGARMDVADGGATFQAGGGEQFEMTVGKGAVGIKGGKLKLGDVEIGKKE
ncbi:MAG: hypothetical protein GY913_06675 [Proteobacteria bacterium]|nr:hypothetical protein [Pseudomonadota bacterium]MCP4916590.1 hypothetical protein [Pseudomonadota bacterium]